MVAAVPKPTGVSSSRGVQLRQPFVRQPHPDQVQRETRWVASVTHAGPIIALDQEFNCGHRRHHPLHPQPLVHTEATRLGIDPSFIRGVFAVLPKPFEYSSICEPIQGNGRVEGVRIRIDARHTRPAGALLDFWREMYHAREYFLGERAPERKASAYACKRLLMRLLHLDR